MKAALFAIALTICSSPFAISQQFEPIQPADTSSALEEAYLVSKRGEMVRLLQERHSIADPRILTAFEATPRHLFVPDNLAKMAYRLSYIPLGKGQVLAEPGLLGAILSALNVKQTDKVFLAGAATPYTAALLSSLADEVYVVEGTGEQYKSGIQNFQTLGLTNIFTKQGISFSSWRDEAPFNCILIHGAVERIPAMVLDMLAPDGRLVCSLADPSGFQMLLVVEKRNDQLSIRSGGQSFFPFLDFL